MLFDDILEFAATPPAKLASYYSPGQIQSLRNLAAQIPSRPRFVLSEEMAFVSEQISESPPSTFVRGLPLCRLPFPRLWLEFSHAYRDNFRRSLPRYEEYYKNEDYAPPPHSVGFLMDEIGDGMIGVTLAWKHPDGQIGFSSMGFSINTGGTVEKPPVDPRKIMEDKTAYTYRFRNRAGEPEAFHELLGRVGEAYSPYAMPYTEEIESIRYTQPDIYRQLREMAEHDLRGEWRFVMAALMMLNSRNIIDTEEVDRSKLSRSRVKRGKPPALNHRTINMRISRGLHNIARSRGMTLDDLKKHLVRGHPKVRKTGVWFWSSFTRGYRGEVEVPTILVRK